MPKMAERKDTMTSNLPATPTEPTITNEPYVSLNDSLTLLELADIAAYTIQKITAYPKSFGKTVENYFHLLYPDEIKSYMIQRTVNSRLSSPAQTEGRIIRQGCRERGLNVER